MSKVVYQVMQDLKGNYYAIDKATGDRVTKLRVNMTQTTNDIRILKEQ